jgi:hypothetical protein
MIQILNPLSHSSFQNPEGGWGTEKSKESFKSEIPGPVRNMLSPKWEKNWRYYKDLLVSITSDEESEFKVKPKKAKGGCVLL